MNILITGHDTFHNKGCQALIFTTTEILKQAFPDAVFTVFSWEPEFDEAHYDNPAIKCKFIKHRFQTNEFSFRNKLWLALNNFGIKTDRIIWVSTSFYNAIKSCDLVVVSGGDILADYGKAAVRHYFFSIAVAKALKKPVYVFAQSISPYKDEKLKKFAKRYLDKVDLITARESVSYEYLKSLKIKSPLYLTADPAFLLKPSQEERLKNILDIENINGNSPVTIGISVSETLTKWGGVDHGDFLKILAVVCDAIIKRYNAKIIFIPHVTYPDNPHNDDRIVVKEILNIMKERESAYIIKGEYSCRDLKAIIGKCSIFIGARTHATIASTSQLIPTIALAYSVKAHGIMKDILDVKQCVIDVKELNADRLVSMVDNLLANKHQVAASMKEHMLDIKAASLRNGELVKSLFT